MTRVVAGNPPPQVDLLVHQGDDFACVVDVVDPNTGDPLDLTGCVILAEVRPEPNSPDLTATFTSTVDVSQVTLMLDHDQTALLVSDQAWDLQAVDPAGLVLTVARGWIKVTGQVSV